MKNDHTFSSNQSPIIETSKKGRFLIHNITDEQKELLKSGGIGLGGLLAGMGIAILPSKLSASDSAETIEVGALGEGCVDPVDDTDEGTPRGLDVPGDVEISEEVAVIYSDAPFADMVNDHMSFDDAFGAARKDVGAGGFFEWRGNTYNTYYKDEWDVLSSDQQNDYWASIDERTDIDGVEYVAKSAYAEHGINIDNDSFSEIILDDVNGDGIVDVKRVDLNNDGHYDVEYVTELSDGHAAIPNAATGKDLSDLDFKTTSDVIEVMPEIGVADLDHNGIYDALAVDTDNDGYADGVVLDENEDGQIDAVVVNMNLDTDLDVVIIDEGNNGFGVGEDKVLGIEEELSMDEFMPIDEEDLDLDTPDDLDFNPELF